ncbi:MAG: hypothetical protein Q8859_12070, partial [Bacteroidota bacterium]|nr:hypothetical protein [Bacteroidota bacterium]
MNKFVANKLPENNSTKGTLRFIPLTSCPGEVSNSSSSVYFFPQHLLNGSHFWVICLRGKIR